MKDTHTLGVSFPVELYHEIRKLAFEEQRSFGSMLRHLVTEALTRRKIRSSTTRGSTPAFAKKQ